GAVSGIHIANLGNDADGKPLVGWSAIDINTGEASTNPTTPVIVDSSHVNTIYIDVQLASTAGNTPSTATLGAGDFTLTGAGSNGVAIAAIAPTLIAGKTYRYYLTGQFALGAVNVAFADHAWTDSAGVQSGAGAASFTVAAPRAAGAPPTPGG